MTNSWQVRLVSEKEESVLNQIEPLFRDLYDYMADHGLVTSLAADGAKKWRGSAEHTLGRLGTLAIAESRGKVIGFARGIVRLSPEHLASEKIGFVDHTFVCQKWRGIGVGRELYNSLEKWFYSKGVRKLELQVLCGNTSAIDTWRAFGFQEELLQMRKILNEPNE